ncbi:MAG: Fic family protein [Ghiorsea sp.]|nr:Fic family protein [Ghiorsea sp.]
MSYHPPFNITPAIIDLIAQISEHVGRLSAQPRHDLRLRRINRIRSIQGSLAIEGNTLSEQQITAILNGKTVVAPPREIQEVKNAILAYDKMNQWQADSEADLLQAHETLMLGLIDEYGVYRQSGVGVMKGNEVIHMAPPAGRVALLMTDLLQWVKVAEHHPLIMSSVFHYEFEFIHPFADGNGRMGRLWQSLILQQWNAFFADIPIENLVYQHQEDYYVALQQSTEHSDSAHFIQFMLKRILDAILQDTPQESPQVTPQVKLLINGIKGEMSREELQNMLGLQDRKSFRERYLKPALEAGLIEMTHPDKPNSKLQKYRRKG